MEDGKEIIVLRFQGGPYGDSSRYVRLDNKNIHWPPPEEIVVSNGVYIRESYSSLPEDSGHNPHVCRGGIYIWKGEKS